MDVSYKSCTNLDKSNLFPVLFLFLGKGDIYLLKYPFSYQVLGQHLITNINKSICDILLENTNRSAVDLKLKLQKTVFFSLIHAKSASIRSTGTKGINRSYTTEKDKSRFNIRGKHLLCNPYIRRE